MPLFVPILAEGLAGSIALMAILVAGLSIYMIATRNRIRRSINQPRNTTRERYSELQQRSRLSRDVEETMVDLDNLARQINGQLDLRFAKLEAVIRDADARIESLNRLLRQAVGASALNELIGDEGANKQASPVSVRGDISSTDAAGASSNQVIHAEVYALADEGLSAADIADRTHRTKGEIELILALRRAKRRSDEVAARSV